MFGPKAVVLTALTALFAAPARAAASYEATPFMTAPEIRDQFTDAQYVFDFSGMIDEAAIKAGGGQVISATIAEYPAVVNNDVSQALVILEPCTAAPIHTHPRATEIAYSIDGTFMNLFFEETGSTRVVKTTTKPNQSTIFPQGVMHTSVNMGCDTAKFIASFNTVDPGLQFTLPQLFLADTNILRQAFQ